MKSICSLMDFETFELASILYIKQLIVFQAKVRKHALPAK
jgi:hypothetical protein